MKTKRWKRVISSIMAVMMCCTAFPGTAYAAKKDMDQMVEGSFTVDGCGKLKITDINGEEYMVETGQTLTLESVPGNTLRTEAIPEDGSLVKRYTVSHTNEEVELEENLDILNAESSYRRDITVSDPFTVQVDFENKETERQNEVKEENATEQTIKEEETLEEKQDDIAEESKEKWIDLMALPELGTDIGNQSLGETLGTAEIVDENTPSLLASEGSICTIVKGVEIPYMSWSTHMFTVNSETGSYPAYCMEPHKSSPSGPATVSILDNDTIKALLLCAYEGPYPMLSPDALVELGVPLEEAKKSIYCITHTVKGTLMDKETGETLLIGGKPVTAEKTFLAGKKDGSVELEFTFDASGLKGKETVVFEKLFYEEKEIAVHEDLDDKNQTVKFQNPEIKTTASDKTTGTNEGIVQKEVTIVDKVEYNNLIPGKEYTVKGILMDKETGKPLLIDGKKVTAEKTFTAKSEAGSIELEFTFDGSTLGEKEIVVFEKLFYNGREIAAHEDIQVANTIEDLTYGSVIKFFDEGYSSKKGHQGLGLHKIAEYGQRYHFEPRVLKINFEERDCLVMIIDL